MAASYRTKYGQDYIDNEALARTAGMAALECYGVVGMASVSYKDGIVQLLLGESLTKGIKVTAEDDHTSIEFHIIVEYGTNISAIAENLISNVKYSVKDLLGIDVSSVSVFVEGIRTEQEKA